MPFEPLPLAVSVRTRSRAEAPLTRLLAALGVGETAADGAPRVCVCDEGEAPPDGADACVRLAADEDAFARARRIIGARNPSPRHPDRGLMPPAGHLASVLAEVAASAALLQALALARGERPAPARVGVEPLALHLILPLVSARSAGSKGLPVRTPTPATPVVYPFGITPCADGEVGVYQAVPTEWPRFCALIGRDDLVEAYPTVESRREHGAAIRAAADPWLSAHTADEAVRLAQEAALPWASVLPLDALPESPYLRRRGVTGPDAGAPWRVERAPADVTPHPDRGAVREALAAALPAPVPGPLAGLIVVEVTQHWAGPLAARLLADHGALVLKCEPPGGDFWRNGGALRDGSGDSWTFEPINLGKGSIALNLRDDADRRLLRTLLGACDVVVENLSREARRRAGLDFAALAGRNPNVVAVSLPGYEAEGPLADWRGMGWSFEAASGYASALGGGVAANSGYPYGDPIGALTAFLALLRELAGRQLRGDAGAALLDVGQVAALAWTLLEPLRAGERGPSLAPLDDALAQGRAEPSWSLERIPTASGRPMDHPLPPTGLAAQPPRRRAPMLDEHGEGVRAGVLSS